MAGPRSARLELAAVPHAPRDARHATQEVLQEWHVPVPVVQDAVLVVSEIVTNAVRHADDTCHLELELAQYGSRLRVSVADGDPGSPTPRRATRASEGGRGMTILAALADRWGIEPRHDGKQVWWEVDLDAASRESVTA